MYPGPPRAKGFPKGIAFYQHFYEERPPFPPQRFFFWTVHCAAGSGFAAYGCGVPLAGAARLSPA